MKRCINDKKRIVLETLQGKAIGKIGIFFTDLKETKKAKTGAVRLCTKPESLKDCESLQNKAERT